MPRCHALLVKIARVVCLAALLASCAPPAMPGGESTPAALPTATLVPMPMYTATAAPLLPMPNQLSEAPTLASLAKAGALPAIEERLPENPKIVAPVEQIGKYGGAWRMVIKPTGDEEQFVRTVGYEPLVRWTTDGAGIEPNLVERYSVNAKATIFDFTLRKGLRWSDGEPFTTEDIRFWYEDVLLNKALTAKIPQWLISGGTHAVFSFVDETSFRVTFSRPNSLFLERLATPDGLALVSFPAHYAGQFHQDYQDEESLQDMISEAGAESWVELFARKVGINPLDNGNFADPNRPRLTAWVPQSPYVSGKESILWTRNPYYWKIDPQGNQLPYLDYVVFQVVNSVDDVISLAVAEEIDMQNLGSAGTEVHSLLLSRKQNDRYNFYKLKSGSSNEMVIQFNLTHPDPVKRELFQNQNFRIALSMAINRQEIIDRVYGGLGKPWQAAPKEDSPFYDPVMAQQYTEYNLEKANQYLDRAGYARDTLGNRLGPDGQPISFTLLGTDDDPLKMAVLNMVAGYWSHIGIDVHAKVETRPLFLATIRSNLHDAVTDQGWGSSLYDILLDPSNYMPSSENAYWAVKWYGPTGSLTQEKVLSSVQKGLQTYEQVRTTVSRAEQARLMKTSLLVARQGFWTVGIVMLPENFGIVRKRFYNVPDEIPSSRYYPDPGPANPEQFFIDVSQS